MTVKRYGGGRPSACAPGAWGCGSRASPNRSRQGSVAASARWTVIGCASSSVRPSLDVISRMSTAQSSTLGSVITRPVGGSQAVQHPPTPAAHPRRRAFPPVEPGPVSHDQPVGPHRAFLPSPIVRTLLDPTVPSRLAGVHTALEPGPPPLGPARPACVIQWIGYAGAAAHTSHQVHWRTQAGSCPAPPVWPASGCYSNHMGAECQM